MARVAMQSRVSLLYFNAFSFDKFPCSPYVLCMNEIWKTVKIADIEVEVSNLGNVRTSDYLAPSKREKQPTQLRKGGLIKPDMNAHYPRVKLKRGGKTYRAYVHRLVALAFVDGHFEGATVDHIDGCRTNNVATNLRWLDRAENTRVQNADGRGVGRGEKHPLAKLKDADIPKLFELRKDGLSYAKIGREFGVHGGTVEHIIKGKIRNHVQLA